jgi:hypothetical protein
MRLIAHLKSKVAYYEQMLGPQSAPIARSSSNANFARPDPGNTINPNQYAKPQYHSGGSSSTSTPSRCNARPQRPAANQLPVPNVPQRQPTPNMISQAPLTLSRRQKPGDAMPMFTANDQYSLLRSQTNQSPHTFSPAPRSQSVTYGAPQRFGDAGGDRSSLEALSNRSMYSPGHDSAQTRPNQLQRSASTMFGVARPGLNSPFADAGRPSTLQRSNASNSQLPRSNTFQVSNPQMQRSNSQLRAPAPQLQRSNTHLPPSKPHLQRSNTQLDKIQGMNTFSSSLSSSNPFASSTPNHLRKPSHPLSLPSMQVPTPRSADRNPSMQAPLSARKFRPVNMNSPSISKHSQSVTNPSIHKRKAESTFPIRERHSLSRIL